MACEKSCTEHTHHPPIDGRCQARLSHWYRCSKPYTSVDLTGGQDPVWTCDGPHIYEEMLVGEPHL